MATSSLLRNASISNPSVAQKTKTSKQSIQAKNKVDKIRERFRPHQHEVITTVFGNEGLGTLGIYI